MKEKKNTILVIDDEAEIRKMLNIFLDTVDFKVVESDCAKQGIRMIASVKPDLVILDLGLPDMDGKDALVKARSFYDGPILILSARDRELEKIEALDRGADDYVEKPFGVGELLARLRVAMRHRLRRQGSQTSVKAGDVEIDLIKRLVTRKGELVHLSPREYDLLACLAEGAGKVLTQAQLLTAVWGPANAADVQYLRVFIGHLRQKLEADPAAPRLLITEPGVGYRFMGE